MVNWLNSKRNGPIGIELGARSLQLVQFTTDRKHLVDAVRWDLPSGIDAGTDTEREAAVVEALRQARQGRKFRGRDVVVSLSARDIFVQNIRVAKLSTAELPKAVQQEATTRLQFPLEQAEICYLSAGDVRQGEQVKREVILLACQREAIKNLLSVVDQAGLRAVAIDVEPAALLRAYSRQFRRDNDKNLRAMFVRVGNANTTVVIAQGAETVLIKYIDVGADHLDEAVARHSKIDLAAAAALRRHNGDRRADQQDPDIVRSVNEATRAVVERLISELALCIRYHSVTFRGQSLSRMVLGGGEAVQSLVDALAQRLDIACELGDPLRSYEFPVSPIRRGQWDVAAGLALKEVH